MDRRGVRAVTTMPARTPRMAIRPWLRWTSVSVASASTPRRLHIVVNRARMVTAEMCPVMASARAGVAPMLSATKRVRDRAIFVGDPDDIVPDAFGAGLPLIRDWTQQHYDFADYVTGFDPRQLGDREMLGYREDERVCVVTVGGSGVGGHLLRRVIAAFPQLVL